VQCLDDFGIPLLLSHTVVDVEGRDRVEAVTIAEVDEHLRPIAGTEVRYPCDTLMLSVGLLPENELSREAGVELSTVTRGPVVDQSLQTNIPGIFACGNVLHVHDLVDFVSQEAAAAGTNAARYVAGGGRDAGDSRGVPVSAENGVRYTVPSFVDVDAMDDTLTVRFRVANEYRNRYVSVYLDDERIQHRKKRVMAPGEMEQVTLKKANLAAREGLAKITVMLEEE
jgi:pyruvate/2-oxoglutarate dehydrogenase complex dihydrolipoamide dehydrogenase (E3) component